MIYQPHKKCEPRLHCANQMRCGNRSATYAEVEEEVIKALKKLMSDMQEMLKNGQPDKPTINNSITSLLQKELNALETQQDRLYDFLEKGIYTSEVFVKRNEVLAKRRAELLEAISEAKEKEVSVTDYKKKIVALHEAIIIMEDKVASAAEKNSLLKSVVKTMIYHRETEIHDKWHPVPFSIDIVLN